MKLDGFCAGQHPTCVEIWSHQGESKNAQKDKVMTDMAKLLLAEKRLKKRCQKIFAVYDQNAIAFLRNSWRGEFAKLFGIQIIVVEVSPKTKDNIKAAQKKQYR